MLRRLWNWFMLFLSSMLFLAMGWLAYWWFVHHNPLKAFFSAWFAVAAGATVVARYVGRHELDDGSSDW